jgi:hypothetical protein
VFIQYPEDAANPAKNNLTIDRSQATAHLEALGYKAGDTVYLRSFYPSNDSRKIGDKGRKAEAKNINQLVQLATQFQSEGRGVYFVVNGGGHTNESVTDCRAIFCEHDNLDKQLQKQLWRSLGLPEPSLQIDTGGKSIHSYWIFNSKIDPQQWKQLQTDLLEYTDADRALKNPSRVMRLAGCWHFAPNNVASGQTKIILNSGKRYSYDELRELIPHYQAELQGISPMIDEWGDMRNLAQHLEGYKPGGRRGWITCKCPVHGGVSNDSLHVNESTGKFHCQKGCDTKEIFKITLEVAKSKGHIVPDKRQPATTKPSNVIPHPTVIKQLMSEDDINSIRKEYRNLLKAGANGTKIESFKISVRQQFSQLQPSELNKLLDEIAKEFQKQQDLIDEAEELAKLVDATEQTINLADYLPAKLAKPLAQYCEWQNLRHAVVFTSFITAVSSLHKVGTELILQRSVGFKVPPTLFGAIVAESGSKKSPIFRATAREPLNVLKKDDAKEYDLEFKQYEAELKQWNESKKGKKGERPQEPPLPPLYYFSDATGEGIKAQAANAPDKALFALVDELAGFFNSSNQYRGGKGSDKQDLLSYFDGTGATVLRSGGIKVDVTQIYLSILGTIQPEILRQAMGNTNDFDGSWARFLIAIQPNTPSELPDENHFGVEMKDLLATYFRAIHNLPITEYRLSKDAFKFYQSWYNRLEQLRVSHPSSGLRAVYSKAEGLTGRLALNLHVLHELASDRTPSIEIPLARIKEAINLMKFYIGQVKMIHATVDDSSNVPQILKVIELSKRKQLAGEDGWIKPREIISNSSKKQRLTSAEARELMVQASNSGYGEIRGSGVKVEFKAFTQNAGQVLASAGDCWSNAGNAKTAETIDNTISQDFAGYAGHDVAFFEDLLEDNKQTVGDRPNDSGYIPEDKQIELITKAVVDQHNQQNAESVDTQGQPPAGHATSNDQQTDQQTSKPTSNLKPGDKVAAACPYELKYSWLGEVKEVSADGEEVLVYWTQREGKAGNPCETHEVSYLRKLESRE